MNEKEAMSNPSGIITIRLFRHDADMPRLAALLNLTIVSDHNTVKGLQ